MHKTHINLMDSTEFEQLQFDLQALQPFLQLTDDGLLSLIEYCFSDVSVTPCFITTGACNFGVIINFSDRFHKASAAIGTLRKCFHGVASV